MAALQEFIFYVSEPRRLRAGGYQFQVASVRLKVYGPYPTRTLADFERRQLARRWRARAESLGGWLRIDDASPTEWVVAVPEGTPVDGIPRRDAEQKPGKGRDPHDDPPLRLRDRGWKAR
jgi:hypothetical protein